MLERSHRSAERGSSMVEVALIAPVFFLILFGFINFSLIMFGYCSATYATRLAVRYAIVHGSSSDQPCTSADLQAVVLPNLWGVPKTGLLITSTWAGSSNAPGSVVTISVSATFVTGIPYSTLRAVKIGNSAQGTIIR